MDKARKQNVIVEMSFQFALKIIELYKQLVNQQEFVLSKQLLKSGTSIGANVQEAQAAQSQKDFISKMSIASKEARETKYWLSLLLKSRLVPDSDPVLETLLKDIEDIINVLTKIVKTSLHNMTKLQKSNR